MHIGASIKLVRKGRYMSQVTLADKAKITQAALSQIESGNSRPGVETMARLARALDTPEAIFHLMAMDKDDFSKDKRELFDALWPTIREMLLRLCS